MIFSKKPINFNILKCEYTDYYGEKTNINFLNNKSFFTTIELINNHGFKIEEDSIEYCGGFKVGVMTITRQNCKMKIRFDKYSYLMKEYCEAKQKMNYKKMLKIENLLYFRIKKRINTIYSALFENY